LGGFGLNQAVQNKNNQKLLPDPVTSPTDPAVPKPSKT
jgi:hypothetical protein